MQPEYISILSIAAPLLYSGMRLVELEHEAPVVVYVVYMALILYIPLCIVYSCPIIRHFDILTF